jgi:hypothetical protein
MSFDSLAQNNTSWQVAKRFHGGELVKNGRRGRARKKSLQNTLSFLSSDGKIAGGIFKF